jgi:hypothetical protein
MKMGVVTGNQNIMIGYQAGYVMTSGNNIGIGGLSQFMMTTGTNNISIGDSSLSHEVGGTNSIAIGYSAGNLQVGASNNTIIGNNVAQFITSGSHNTILGASSASAYVGAETGNIIIGYNVPGTAAENTTTRIGVQGTQIATYIAGISGVGIAGAAVLVAATGQLGVAVSSRRYKENIDDMDDASDAIYKLRPVVFNYKNDESRHVQYGLIAEEVEDVMPRLTTYDEDAQPHSVKYHDLPVLLLNEIQKLNARISDLESCRMPRKRNHESSCKSCTL